MNEPGTPASRPASAGDLPGFFGAEEGRPRERIDPEVWTRIDRFLENHPGGRERLVPLLRLAQQHLGHLPHEVQEYIADRLGLSPVQVYGVVSFYPLFTTTPRARYRITLCLGTSCFVRKTRRVLAALEVECQTELGGISADGLFNLDRANCLGTCDLGPAITINEAVHANLTAEDARRLVRRLRAEANR